jgi:hypothetical protein
MTDISFAQRLFNIQCLVAKQKDSQSAKKVNSLLKAKKSRGLNHHETRMLTYWLKEHAPIEMEDWIDVYEMGAEKHGLDNWLKPNGKTSSHKDMHASMFRHLAESSAGIRADKESGLDPLLHLACRALMCYTRIKRGIDNGSY